MEYNLIADAGSTKIDWALTDLQGGEVTHFTTRGLNALLATADQTESLMKEASSLLPGTASPTAIWYYGAGCATPEICDRMRSAIRAILKADEISISSDLLGAARSLLGHERGIACILGTGSNSCLYDGTNIIRNIPSLGFILGDEGGGASLGKRLIADAFKGLLPSAITDRLLEKYNLTLADILDKVYRNPAPNKFLASFVPFLRDHLRNPYVYSLVYTEFQNFLTRNVTHYQGAHSLPISFTGSIAFHFADVLKDAADSLGLTVGTITPQPLEGLVKYHYKNTQK